MLVPTPKVDIAQINKATLFIQFSCRVVSGYNIQTNGFVALLACKIYAKLYYMLAYALSLMPMQDF